MKRFSLTCAVVLTALLLAGCTAPGASTGSAPSSEGSGSSDQSDQSGQTDQSGKSIQPGDAVAPEGSTGNVTSENRDVITTGSVSITVDDPIKSAQAAVTITEQAGGRIDSRTENPATDNQPASANLALRIPSDELDRTLAELKKLGTVNFVSLNASDITQQTKDLDARITSLQTSVDRLLTLMQQATSTTDLIAIESALASRQSELEGLQSQRDYLADQVDFSTISLDLYSTGTVAPGSPDDFWTGILAGWNALVAALAAAMVGVGFALPWLLALSLVAAIVGLVVWLSTRRRKAD
ncbi:DUF4349 domain-containing protein [Cryobacterium sp. TMT1-21]|uniref:DUF4349 domain-containing protein n=1 Tax=unclassified Cryobacterium TaxID=2649013 RepID=UPI00106BDF8D|nr:MULTISPECIES: DUF4349 domain-containing protein [unclassified Cryobacterium]TFC80742.1 DUF4349 domain-containing protein [Cryobacterium sp. TmT2-59]TFD17325.1 DUF4349 domain-containing protein [Cryobacterium sp. TMT1-21]TFD20345.1 DUF4349 domain-containing protein [Cryobacterium sp. TMT2-23]TFD22350.1 DUF4349 domain-containing protein [Cryobacterium sp. TMT4-10]TFD39974.1 DUF4349 domain-containing protein [Cryobacterium sp. TMT2-10]